MTNDERITKALYFIAVAEEAMEKFSAFMAKSIKDEGVKIPDGLEGMTFFQRDLLLANATETVLWNLEQMQTCLVMPLSELAEKIAEADKIMEQVEKAKIKPSFQRVK